MGERGTRIAVVGVDLFEAVSAFVAAVITAFGPRRRAAPRSAI